ncbi:major facilitator superfamily protein [Deinococcus aerius]|uniref:Major facilitator superfamily protein n=1 Tax=Deinococcus aerius TaxID=200253 RepID=A0A2I9DBB1_9DEIO|nr:MFS transporter [Deinococcus aerius]GBF08246.1 major facilitator superfamily protein [Deinococcus aerius]
MSVPVSHPAARAAPPPALGAGLLLVVLAVAFESMAVGTVLPRVAEDLRGLNLYGWASSAFLLSSLVGAVLFGTLADRRGLAFAATLGLAVFALGLLVAGAAPGMGVFVLGRLVQGLGAGGLGALPFAVISARYPESARAPMLAAVSGAWLLPALVGPLVASLIADAWSWRAVFWGLVPALALVAPLCVLPLRGGGREPVRAGGGLLWPALGLALGAGLLVEGLRRPDLLALPLVLLGGGGVGLASRRLFPRGMWRLAPGLPAMLMVRGWAAFALLGANSFLPLALHEGRGLSLTQAGWVLSVGGATWTLGSWVQSGLERRFGPGSRPLRIRLGMVVVTAGLTVTALAALGHLPLWGAYAGWFVAALGMGVGYNSNSLLALSSAGPREAGGLSAQLANIEVLMTAVAAGGAGALIVRAQPLHTAFALAFLVALLGSLVAWVGAARVGGR